ncbi:molybdenum cofactor guanylyltransferase MobA [uncultured Parasutterella sp.]|uniref:molybdenum cofactor guanylyltransferase MobA n=1 Tax=uncultured Parasutterella sp. TaxID=1263098 RepID=UPI0025B6CAE5|nr:molybdenum cofactor guanylyltransferase MobA [uncultured Parasutterella sp.]
MPQCKVSAVLLAGGEAKRMGRVNKGFQPLNGAVLAEHVLSSLKHQTSDIYISANSYADEYALRFPFPVFPDIRDDFLGPLAGIETVLTRAPNIEWLFCCPVDTPYIPDNLVPSLLNNAITLGRTAAYPCHNGKAEPLHCLLHSSVLPELTAYLDADKRSVFRFLNSVDAVEVPIETEDDSFINLNTIEELRQAEMKQTSKDSIEN